MLTLNFFGLFRRVDQLQRQRTSSDDARASWKEISSDEVLQDGTFARTLNIERQRMMQRFHRARQRTWEPTTTI